MSVTLAPRARMAVKAAWPGVSMKVILWPFVLDLVGADVLGDAAGLARDDVGLADGVEQRGLAVVDVAHDGDHRRTRLEVASSSAGAANRPFLDVDFGDAAHGVAHLLGDELGGVGVDHVVGLRPSGPASSGT